MQIPTPFDNARDVVRPEWIDYNGHMNVGYYQVVFDIAADTFFNFLGLTQEFRIRHASTTFALESHGNYLSYRQIWCMRVDQAAARWG